MSERDVGAARTTGAMLVAGRYRLAAVIGAGGMGRVWLAHDETLDRRVALKEVVPPPGLAVGERRTVALRAMAEARAAARLEHPGLVRVYDVVRTTGRSWIVMEHIESRSLQARIDQDGALPHREAARVGLAVLEALRAAHDAGVLHRDIKPDNILLADDGRVMLTDFGLAVLDTAPEGNGAPLLGSPNYVAPERLLGRATGAATDLWSLGATLYAMVEGRPPFQRADTAAALTAVTQDPPGPAHHPGPLHLLIGRLLAKNPDERPDAAEAQALLQTVAGRVPVALTIPLPRRPVDDGPLPYRGTARGTAAVPHDSLAEPEPVARPSRRRAVLAGAAVAVVLTGGGAVAWRWPVDRPAVPVAEATRSPAPAVGCAGPATATPVTGTPHRDPAGFEIRVPAGWTRTVKDGEVCFGAPEGGRAIAVRRADATTAGPLAYWQATERARLDAGELPGYRRISMGVLLVTDGGADWEYTWQPAAGPLLHTHRYLMWANAAQAYEVSWTAPDAGWSTGLATQRAVVGSVRDPRNTAPTWSVPSPQ